MATDTGLGEVRFFDDFTQDTYDTFAWAVASTNSATAPAINVAANGTLRGTVTNNSSNDASSAYTPVIYKATAGGPLVMEARVALITSTSQLVFVGLTAQVCSAPGSIPMDYNGGSLTTNATNAVGFYWCGGTGTPGSWYCGGVKAGADSTQTLANTKFVPAVATYQTLRIVVNENGAASFYINGETIAENIANACTAGTLMAANICNVDDGAAGSLDTDYVRVKCGRV